MKQKRRYKKYSISVRQSAVDRMRLGVNVSQLAEQLGVNRGTLYAWSKQAEQRSGAKPASATVDAVEQYQERAGELECKQHDYRIRELESKLAAVEGELGRAEWEKRFFEAALRRVKGSRQNNEDSGVTASSPRSATGRTRKAD